MMRFGSGEKTGLRLRSLLRIIPDFGVLLLGSDAIMKWMIMVSTGLNWMRT